MSKPKTLIERFGFKDKDLSTPEHDRLLCWLWNKENILCMLGHLKLLKINRCIHLNDWRGRHADEETCDWNFDSNECSGTCTSRAEDKIRLRQAVLANWKRFEAIKNESEIKVAQKLIDLKAEYQIVEGKFNIGSVDAVIELKEKMEQPDEIGYCHFSRQIFEPEKCLVEIKTNIESLGELVRQINFYRSHVNDGQWIVLTSKMPEAFRPILASEHIAVYIVKRETKNGLEDFQ